MHFLRCLSRGIKTHPWHRIPDPGRLENSFVIEFRASREREAPHPARASCVAKATDRVDERARAIESSRTIASKSE